MIEYAKEIIKEAKKGKIPERVFLQFHHCFQSIEQVGDFSIFDIKQIKGDYQHQYFRIRKGQYRAIFYLDDTTITVVALEHRSEAYRKWQ